MNIQNLRENYPKLISYMKNEGYSKRHIDGFMREITKILALNSKSWSNYKDVYLEYAKTSLSPHTLRGRRTAIGAIEQFDVYGKYPDRKRKHELFERRPYNLLSSEFKSVIDLYCEVEKKRGRKLSTIKRQSSNASTFFLSFQKKGINTLEEITEEAVLSVFISPDEKLLKSYSYKRNVAAVLKACISQYPETCSQILAFLPALRATRKNIQYFTPEEIYKIKKALINDGSLLARRDKAIGIIAFYTGLRGCDIVGLTFDAIDWEQDLIYIRQQKTQEPLELPLTAIVGNAIHEYLTEERPHTNSKYIFVSQLKPYDRLKSNSLGRVAANIMKAAGIRQSKGDRKGLHIFRHHFATALLQNDVPQPIISKTLGHISPNSIEAYLSTDFKRLKECAISIERFSVSKEVFSHE